MNKDNITRLCKATILMTIAILLSYGINLLHSILPEWGQITLRIASVLIAIVCFYVLLERR